jgi:hypothetical protein
VKLIRREVLFARGVSTLAVILPEIRKCPFQLPFVRRPDHPVPGRKQRLGYGLRVWLSVSAVISIRGRAIAGSTTKELDEAQGRLCLDRPGLAAGRSGQFRTTVDDENPDLID